MAGVPVQLSTAFGSTQPPHVPQVATVDRSASHPLEGSMSQSSNPGSQAMTSHMPSAHIAVAWASEHATPQAPQSVSVFSGVSHPFSAPPSQSANPGRHS